MSPLLDLDPHLDAPQPDQAGRRDEQAEALRGVADLLSPPAVTSPRVELDADSVRNGLGQLVLTLVKLLHELLEKQAIRRMEAGTLDDAQIEAIGSTLMRQAEEIERLREVFHLDEDDLNLDLGPLGRLL